MIAVKRIEMIIDASHTPLLIRALKAADAPGYTLVRDVQAAGDRGERGGDVLTNVFRNCYLIVAAPPDKVEAILDAVRPLLEQYGGMCLVSDAQWLSH